MVENYFEDYKANEIAGILNIPVNTVYSLLKRGKENVFNYRTWKPRRRICKNKA